MQTNRCTNKITVLFTHAILYTRLDNSPVINVDSSKRLYSYYTAIVIDWCLMDNDVTNESHMLLNRFNTCGNVSIKRIIFDEPFFLNYPSNYGQITRSHEDVVSCS